MEQGRPRRLRELFDAAVDLDPGARLPFLTRACPDDATLVAEVLALLRLHDGAESEPAPTAPDDLSGTRVGAYRIDRLLGEGGMGRVYLASRIDGAFDRLVAIKVIAPHLLDASSIERFEHERRLLARLRHPNIAELLDAGRTSEGLLYFVLEYVDGVPLTAYSRAKRLSVRARVALARQVCDAVAEAHRHLIVHRDLKPGNILVDGSGVPKLLDFGIAKQVTAAGVEVGPRTSTLERRATPAYASPEHLHGDDATVAMDIYSLGVVLYELVAGCPPVPRSSDADTTTGEPFVSPSDAAWGFDGGTGPDRAVGGDADLDAIVLTCLRRDPRARYGSVDALAGDLQAWLTGHPVQARPLTPLGRTVRLVRRHRLASLTTALAAVATVAAAVLFAGLWIRAERQRAREQTVAEHARTLAGATFEVERTLGDLPGATRPRRRLVDAIAAYLSALGFDDDTSLAVERAEGFRRLGDIHGGPGGPNLGEPHVAEGHYRTALTILDGLAPDDRSRDADLAVVRTRVSLGDLLAQQGALAGAEAEYRQALSILEATADATPGDGTRAAMRSGIYRPLSDLRAGLGDLDGALDHLTAALATDLALASQSPEDPESHRRLVLDHLRLARLHRARGDLEEAARSHERADDALRQVAARGGESAGVRRDAAVGRVDMGTTLAASGQWSAGVAEVERAVTELRALVGADEADARVRRDLVVALVQWSDLLATRDVEASRRPLEEARELALLQAGGAPGSRPAADELRVVDQRLEDARLGRPRAQLHLFRVERDRRVPLRIDDQPNLRSDVAAVASVPPGWTPYLLVFGAEGPAYLLDDADLNGGAWTVTLAGPAPSQTLLLVAVPRPLSMAARARLRADVESVAAPRSVDLGSTIDWSQAEPQLESLISPRAVEPVQWATSLRERIRRLGAVAVSGRTFRVVASAPSPGS